MSKLTKNQKVAEAKIESNKQYKLSEACSLVKETSFTKFDASVDIAVSACDAHPTTANTAISSAGRRK